LALVVALAARPPGVYPAVPEQVLVAVQAVFPPAVSMVQVPLALLVVAAYLPAPPVVAPVGGHDRYRFSGQ